jgi:hypothetical protein
MMHGHEKSDPATVTSVSRADRACALERDGGRLHQPRYLHC